MPIHNSRVRLITDPWLNIQPSELETIEANLCAAINGTDGSTHSPSTAITITGSGLQVTGPLKVQRGGTVTVTTAGAIVLDGGYPAWAASTNYADGAVVVPTPLNGRRYVCTTAGTSAATSPTFPTAYSATVTDNAVVWTCLGPDGDVPQYGPGHAGRTSTVVHALAGGRPVAPGTWRVRNVDGMVQAIAPMMDISDGNGPQPARWIVPLRMHDAATVSSVSVSFRVGWPHTALPNVMPGARLLRLPTSGIPQFLTSVAAGADPSGFTYLAKPASAAAWTGQQTLTFACDQNNVIDMANFTYVLELIEEQWAGGPQYPWSLVMFQPVAFASTAYIPSFSGLTTIDGYAPADGARLLVKDTGAGPGNGIYNVQSGAWTLAADFAAASQFSQGMIVPVSGGTVNGGSYWQVASTYTSWTGPADPNDLPFVARGSDDNDTSGNTGTEFFAHGCIWGAAAVSYTGISQQDFQ